MPAKSAAAALRIVHKLWRKQQAVFFGKHYGLHVEMVPNGIA
jgi:hypothetical protein